MDTNPDSVAVGVTEDGTVVFYDLAAQTGIRRLTPKRRREPLGKSVPPIIVTDELAMALTNARRRTPADDGFDYMPGFGWTCRTCGTTVTKPTRDPATERRYCQICALDSKRT